MCARLSTLFLLGVAATGCSDPAEPGRESPLESLFVDGAGWRTIVSRSDAAEDVQTIFKQGRILHASDARVVVHHSGTELTPTGQFIRGELFAVAPDGSALRELGDLSFYGRIDDSTGAGDKEDFKYRYVGTDDVIFQVRKNGLDLLITKLVNGLDGDHSEYADAAGPKNYHPGTTPGNSVTLGYNPGLSLRFELSPDGDRLIAFDRAYTYDTEVSMWTSESRAHGTTHVLHGTAGLGTTAASVSTSTGAHWYGDDWLLFAFHRLEPNRSDGPTRFSVLEQTTMPHPGALGQNMDLSPLALLDVTSTSEIEHTMTTTRRIYVREDGPVWHLFTHDATTVSRWDFVPADGTITAVFVDEPFPVESGMKREVVTRFGTDGSVVHGYFVDTSSGPINSVHHLASGGGWSQLLDAAALRETGTMFADVEMLGATPVVMVQHGNPGDYRISVAILE